VKNVIVFLIVYATLIFATVFGLSLLGEERIDVYAALFAVEFFITSEITSPFTPTEHHKIKILGMIMMVLFIGIVVERIIDILR